MMPIVTPYPYFGGAHAETAALANAAAAYGIKATHDGKAYSEAMLLGVGGGLGAGYLTFDFREQAEKILVFGWRNRWNYTVEWYSNLCQRLGLSRKIEEGDPKGAEKALDAALEKGVPALVWVDRASLPYYQMPEWTIACFGHVVVVYGSEGDTVLIDDLAARPFRISRSELTAARERIYSHKNRLMIVNGGGRADLPDAIIEGLRDHIQHLSQPSDTFALPVYQKWAKLLTHRTDKKGWPILFQNRVGLFSALTSIYEHVEIFSTGGGGLRELYADFLTEAAPILNKPALHEVALQYREIGQRWRTFAESALPDEIEPLKIARSWLRLRRDALLVKGGEALPEVTPMTQKLTALRNEYNKALPLDETTMNALFASLAEQLNVIFEAETAALGVLKEAIA
jgi:hypothetical protein